MLYQGTPRVFFLIFSNFFIENQVFFKICGIPKPEVGGCQSTLKGLLILPSYKNAEFFVVFGIWNLQYSQKLQILRPNATAHLLLVFDM